MTAIGDYLADHPRIQGLSWRAIGELVGVSYETVRQVIQGRRLPDDRTLLAFAAKLPAPEKTLRKLLAQDRHGKFPTPEEWDLFDVDERDAMLRIGDQLLVSSGKKPPHQRRERKPAEESNVTPLPAPTDHGRRRVQRAAHNRPTSDDGS